MKIRIKNFGPIKNGLLENEGWIDISKNTIFIGNQGSGKSTIAKIIAGLYEVEDGKVFIDECWIYRLKSALFSVFQCTPIRYKSAGVSG